MREKSLGEILFNNQKELREIREAGREQRDEEKYREAKVDLDNILVLVEQKIRSGGDLLSFLFSPRNADHYADFLDKWCDDRGLSFASEATWGKLFYADGGMVNPGVNRQLDCIRFFPKQGLNK